MKMGFNSINWRNTKHFGRLYSERPVNVYKDGWPNMVTLHARLILPLFPVSQVEKYSQILACKIFCYLGYYCHIFSPYTYAEIELTASGLGYNSGTTSMIVLIFLHTMFSRKVCKSLSSLGAMYIIRDTLSDSTLSAPMWHKSILHCFLGLNCFKISNELETKYFLKPYLDLCHIFLLPKACKIVCQKAKKYVWHPREC